MSTIWESFLAKFSGLLSRLRRLLGPFKQPLFYHPSSLRVTIVGGGLAGLLAARVLRENQNVLILERSRNPQEIGAGINIGPNDGRILSKLGFSVEKCGSLCVGLTRTWNKDGKLVKEQKLDCVEDWGAPWLFQHRADLRAEFLRMATTNSDEMGIKGNPAMIRYGTKVVDVDVEKGIVTLDSGERIWSDLVIGADGIKSKIRPLVIGEESFACARPSGLSAFRFTLERKIVLDSIPNLRSLDKHKPVTMDMILSFDPSQRSVVMFPCRSFSMLNVVCIVPDSYLQSGSTESWSASGSVEDMLPCFADYPSWVLDIMKLGTDIKLWQLRDQDPLPTYVKGRTVLIGDAAHAMTPHQGQGATQAVEDAEGFELFNFGLVNRERVSSILEDFDAVRRPRASQIQVNTRQATSKRSAKDVYSFRKYNWAYPGIIEGLRRIRAGEELVQYA